MRLLASFCKFLSSFCQASVKFLLSFCQAHWSSFCQAFKIGLGFVFVQKDPIHKKIMATREDYVNKDMFDPDEAIAAAVKKRKFLLKRLLEDQGRFPEQ